MRSRVSSFRLPEKKTVGLHMLYIYEKGFTRWRLLRLVQPTYATASAVVTAKSSAVVPMPTADGSWPAAPLAVAVLAVMVLVDDVVLVEDVVLIELDVMLVPSSARRWSRASRQP